MTRVAYDVAKNDREDLEGKIIKYITSDGSEYKGQVIGVNRAVGITVANLYYGYNDAPKNLCCYRGPVCPIPCDTDDWVVSWDQMYDYVVSKIEQGVYKVNDVVVFKTGVPPYGGGSPGACAYSM